MVSFELAIGSANLISVYIDPKYEEEVSGCTASVGLISKTTIYVVSTIFDSFLKDSLLISPRAMLVTHVLSLGLEAEPNLYHTTISLKMRVRFCCFVSQGLDLLFIQERKLEYVLPEDSLILVVSTATLRCLEPLVISSSRRAQNSHRSSKL